MDEAARAPWEHKARACNAGAPLPGRATPPACPACRGQKKARTCGMPVKIRKRKGAAAAAPAEESPAAPVVGGVPEDARRGASARDEASVEAHGDARGDARGEASVAAVRVDAGGASAMASSTITPASPGASASPMPGHRLIGRLLTRTHNQFGRRIFQDLAARRLRGDDPVWARDLVHSRSRDLEFVPWRFCHLWLLALARSHASFLSHRRFGRAARAARRCGGASRASGRLCLDRHSSPRSPRSSAVLIRLLSRGCAVGANPPRGGAIGPPRASTTAGNTDARSVCCSGRCGAIARTRCGGHAWDDKGDHLVHKVARVVILRATTSRLSIAEANRLLLDLGLLGALRACAND